MKGDDPNEGMHFMDFHEAGRLLTDEQELEVIRQLEAKRAASREWDWTILAIAALVVMVCVIDLLRN